MEKKETVAVDHPGCKITKQKHILAQKVFAILSPLLFKKEKK